MTALAPTAPTRRGRSVHCDVPALGVSVAAGGMSAVRMARTGGFGKGNRQSRDSTRGIDV